MADSTKWRAAIKYELSLVSRMGPRKRESCLQGDARSRPKWVFKTKVNADGSLRYKAWLVVRTLGQTKGLDYQETFELVAKFPTLSVLLAKATHFNWEIYIIWMLRKPLLPLAQRNCLYNAAGGTWRVSACSQAQSKDTKAAQVSLWPQTSSI